MLLTVLDKHTFVVASKELLIYIIYVDEAMIALRVI